MRFEQENLYYSPKTRSLSDHRAQTLCGETVYRVWLPGKDTAVRVPATCFRPAHGASAGTADGIAYFTAVARKIPENVLQEDPKLLMWYDQAVKRSGERE